jgi:hypothetical protein
MTFHPFSCRILFRRVLFYHPFSSFGKVVIKNPGKETSVEGKENATQFAIEKGRKRGNLA